MNYTIVSFGTVRPVAYRRGMTATHRACKRLGIPNYMWKVESAIPGYKRMFLYKPTFIKQMLHGFCDTVVWIDADCIVLHKFELPEGDWDIGLMPHPTPRNRIHSTPWSSFLIAVRPTNRARRFLDLWEHFCQWEDLAEGDHPRLIWALAIMEQLSPDAKLRVRNILPALRGNVFMDPRHRKRNKFTYQEVPAEVDNWDPKMRISW